MDHPRARPRPGRLLLLPLSFLLIGGCGSARPDFPPTPEPRPEAEPERRPEPEPPRRPERPPPPPADSPNVTFRVKWDARYVGGEVEVRGLVRRAAVHRSRSGEDRNVLTGSPATTVHGPITLLREPGVDDAFERWAEKVFSPSAGAGRERALADYRKHIVIEVRDASGGLIAVYNAYRCWPSEHAAAALPEGEETTFREWLVLECDGWERDYASER